MAKRVAKKPRKIILPAKQTLYQKVSLFFFRRPRRTAIIWLVITLLGVASYTALLKREGFPSVETPFALQQGAYLVNDPSRVDRDVAKPLSEFLLKQDGVDKVITQSFDNFYVTTVQYDQDVDALKRSPELQGEIDKQNVIPKNATGELKAFQFGFTERGDDLVIAFYSENPDADPQQTVAKANKAAGFLKSQNIPGVEDISVISPFEKALNPVTGLDEDTQKNFDRFAVRDGDKTVFHEAFIIGVQTKSDIDQLKLDDEFAAALDKLNAQAEFDGYKAQVSGSNAPYIRAQVNELQQTLLEGLLAILVVGSLVIAIRASLITVFALLSVLAAVNALFLAIGYSLNTITLFGLVLALSLIVDDTIIMTEALDAQRRRLRKADEVVKVATGKVGRAMMAATLTAALSFAPLLFVGGILGEFIRAIPITIISALLVSLVVALVFIPLLARLILLRDKQMGPKNARKGGFALEAKIAEYVARPMLWARNSRKKMIGVIVVAILIGLTFIGASGALFQKVKFSIFPADKDSNQIGVTLTFPPGTSIEEAQQIADRAHRIVGDELGGNLVRASYYGQANVQRAMLFIEITDYKERDILAPELVNQLNDELKDFDEGTAKAAQIGAGPPASAFSARVESSQNREAGLRLANDIADFLRTTELKRPDGTVAKIDRVIEPNPQVYNREDDKQYVEAGAEFVDTDTSALVTIAQDAVEEEFPKSRIASYGLDENALSFNFGQENENQESFKTLAIAFPLLLLAIYVLLAAQFKSLLQPLLIFLAIPFSLLGITLGLYLTNNPFSFFAALGFFALIGLSIKNTILLTDYANQARRAGMHPVDAAHEALAERFRPLVATSLTAVFSLIPLALTSPFWEGLTVVLIFGLLSSTFLVIIVFPYYYLASEYLRERFSRKIVIIWLMATVALIIILSSSGFGGIAALAPLATALLLYFFKKRRFI